MDERQAFLVHYRVQIGQEIEPLLDLLRRGLVGRGELLTSPVDGHLRTDIEIPRPEEHRLVVVAQNREVHLFLDDVHTLSRVWPIANNVAQTHNPGDISGANILKNSLEGEQVAVYVGQNGDQDA